MPDIVTASPKSFLVSKTIWANVVAFVLAFLGAHHLQVSADEQSAIIAGLITGLNVLLRWITKQPITLSLPGSAPPAPPGASTGPIAKALGVVALLLVATVWLNACKSLTPAQTEYGLRATFTASLQAAVDYENLPACVNGGPKLCSDPKVVTQVINGAAKAGAAFALLDLAQTAAADVRATSKPDIGAALIAVQAALGAFQTLVDGLPKSSTGAGA